MIFLALGSNLTSSFGDRFANINLAISYLEGYGIQILINLIFTKRIHTPIKKILNLLTSLFPLKPICPQWI